MFKNRRLLGILLSIVMVLTFSIGGYASYYKYTQESGANFYVGTGDKSDALEDTNQVRQILDDLGNLLVHSKRNDLYPKDGTTGGTVQIPEAGLKFSNAPVNNDIAAYIAGEMTWQTKSELGLDLSLYYLKTEMDSESELEGILVGVSDVLTNNDLTNIVYCNDYDNPDDAITAIASANKTLLVTEAETCDTNFTVPANVTVRFERGGKWTINGTGGGYLTTDVFTGSGLDDLTTNDAFTGGASTDYKIQIDGVNGIKTSTLGVGGTGYAVDDTFTVNTGSVLATGKVLTINAGVVLTYSILTSGSGYTVANGVATTATLGVGTGLTINITVLHDTFKWSDDGGSTWDATGVAMTGSAQSLNNGVEITFGATTGHTATDYWTFTGKTGVKVTFNGQIDAGLWQIFAYTGTGTLNFGVEATEKAYPQWWGAVANGTTNCSPAIINAIKSLPSKGGTVYLVAGTYRCNSSITFPIDTGIIKNIRIQGESSGLACGGATNVYGTRIDSYINGGSLFDLYTDTPECINVQFRDFECYDREATGANYGIKAYSFKTGCIVENVGFKLFTHAIYVTNSCYYAKFDRVASFYARDIGIYIEGANGVLFNRIQCANGDSVGLYLKASVTHLRGVTILNSYFEGNEDSRGLLVATSGNYDAHGVNVIGCYFEGNGEISNNASLELLGVSLDHTIHNGVIQGNYFAGTANSVSIALGYAKNILVQGNRVFAYRNNRCISSVNCQDCMFVSNMYSSSASTPLYVPDDNYFIEPGLDKAKLPKSVSKVITITDGDATPDVSDGNIFITSSNTAACEITDLDNPTVGQIVTLIGGSDTNSSTITDGGNFKLSATMTLGLDDSITLFVKADNNYIELSRSVN